ncbi:MAG: haloacid dehalogenase-like hydrolase [Candidatus Limnocylindrales bacterium]
MSRAAATPVFAPGGAPVSFLVDFDGTISRSDVGDDLLASYGPDAALLAAKDADYDAGLIGSRELMLWDMAALPDDPALLRIAAAEVPLDETFSSFVAAVQAAGAAIEIVSDGLGFYVVPSLTALQPSLAELPMATNENRLAGPGGMSFPFGHPACFVCGTCKRERVRAHAADGRVVVFVGDGTSDRYAAHHADIVFAKGSLARWCLEAGWPFRPWHRFAEIEAWTRSAFADGGLPGRPEDLDAWRAAHPRPRTGFICGPEAWGPGRAAPDRAPGSA